MRSGTRCEPRSHSIVTGGATPALTSAAAHARRPDTGYRPAHRLTIPSSGRSSCESTASLVDHRDLSRRRVRELLCLLVARRRVRREVVADILWPEVTNALHNLRVTLNYLQRILEPDRPANEPSYFVRTGGDTLALVPATTCAATSGSSPPTSTPPTRPSGRATPPPPSPPTRRPCRCGEAIPYDDVAYADWARDEQTHWTLRYSVAAVRAGELLLAKGDDHEACSGRRTRHRRGPHPRARLPAPRPSTPRRQ